MNVLFVDEYKDGRVYKQKCEPYQTGEHFPYKFIYLEKSDLLLVGERQDLQHKDLIEIAKNHVSPEPEDDDVVAAGEINEDKISWGSIGFKIHNSPPQVLQKKIRNALIL